MEKIYNVIGLIALLVIAAVLWAAGMSPGYAQSVTPASDASPALAFIFANFGTVILAAATAFGAWLGRSLPAVLRGLIEDKNLRTLNAALWTGVQAGIAGNLTPNATAISAVEYAKISTPGAISVLKATEGVLLTKAKAALADAIAHNK